MNTSTLTATHVLLALQSLCYRHFCFIVEYYYTCNYKLYGGYCIAAMAMYRAQYFE